MMLKKSYFWPLSRQAKALFAAVAAFAASLVAFWAGDGSLELVREGGSSLGIAFASWLAAWASSNSTEEA